MFDEVRTLAVAALRPQSRRLWTSDFLTLSLLRVTHGKHCEFPEQFGGILEVGLVHWGLVVLNRIEVLM
jgi:hypothetical protein